jgi:cysteine-rich repeat protein
VVDGGETCDDGNLIDGDGCNSVCGADGGGGDCGCRVAPRRRLPGIGALLLLAFAGVALAWSRRRRPDRAR